MMKNVRKSKWRQLKLLIALPLIGVFLWSFSEPDYVYDKGSENKVTQQSQNSEDTFLLSGCVLGKVDTLDILKEDGTYVETTISQALEGTQITIKGTSKGTIARPDEGGRFELEVSKGDEIVFSFVGYKTKIIKVEDDNFLEVAMEETIYELDPSIHYDIEKQEATAVKNKNEEPVFLVVEDMPSYIGGNDLFFEKLKELIKIEKSKDRNLCGKPRLIFKVDSYGKLNVMLPDYQNIRNEEIVAINLIMSLGDWNPGKQRGKAVVTQIAIPVDFD